MKQRAASVLISAIVLMILIFFFGWIKDRCNAPVPEPSVSGGYYSAPFTLELQAPEDGTIYYTLDGSTPTTQSAVYEDGIALSDRSSEPNVYNAIQNVVEDWKNYSPKLTPVTKGTVVRAIYVNDWGISSEVMTQTYFVGVEAPDWGYTFSLVFEDEDVFGENGIYVTGEAYDQWYLTGDTTVPKPVLNFNQHLQTQALVQVFEGTDLLFSQPVALRIQGGSKRGWDKKRFILEAEEELGGSSFFYQPLFEGISTHSIMTKDCPTDAMVYDLVGDRAAATQKSTSARVFLNGELWYTYYALERFDHQYFRQYYDVDEVMLVKSAVVDPDITRYQDAYPEFMWWVGHTDFTDPEQWEQLKKEADLQSYIDYMVINYYLCNWDLADDKNYVVWRSVDQEDSPYADQRWRWCVFDIDPLEYTLTHYDLENIAQLNTFTCDPPYCDNSLDQMTLFRAFRNVEEFRQRFVTSFMDIVNNNFDPERVEKILEKYGKNLDWLDGFFRQRPAYAAAHLAEEFDLTGELETVSITTRDPELGTVVVNTSEIDLTEGSWSGKYYEDYPITITAYPAEGCRFVGWKGDVEDGAESLTIPVDGGVSLEAVFQRE